MSDYHYRHLEINGGIVTENSLFRLHLPAIKRGYADAQIDDFVIPSGIASGKARRAEGKWRPGTELSFRARFSHTSERLVGTAGFGFWNAPWGDPTIRGLALPQATWFFNASVPSDLPFAIEGKGRGWFVATVDVSPRSAMLLAPLAPFVLLLNQFKRLRRGVWPSIRRRMKISYFQIKSELREWHDYELAWLTDKCRFAVDGRSVFESDHSPRGPLGFVCWIDNQYLIATNRGRFKWGVLPTSESQWLEVANLRIRKTNPQNGG